MARRRRATLICISAGMLVLGLSSCRRPVAPATPGPVPAIEVGTPEDAARSLLHHLQAHLDAVARHDRAAAADCLDRIEQQLVAADLIIKRLKAGGLRQSVTDPQALREHVKSWAAMIEYYAQGIDFGAARIAERVQRGDRNPEMVSVRLPARGRRGETVMVDVVVRPDPEGHWQAAALEFVRPGARTSASTASAPATAPGSAPTTQR
jgi:hypothetical protein